MVEIGGPGVDTGHMPRAIWSGSISFGLVSIPVKLYSAISEKSVRFNQIDSRNGARVRQMRVNAETGEEVPYAEIVKGFEIAKDTYVTVTDEELAAFAPDATHSLDLECFVDLDEIDPIFFDGAYHVAPSTVAKPYALLVRAMEEANKVAIARFVMRSKEHVAVLRPRDGTLVLSMMVYADELNAASDIGEFDDVVAVEVDQRELAMAESLIASLSEAFEPESYHDTYRDKVLDLVERKSSGEVVRADVTAAPSADAVVDLMAALEASVRAAKASRSRHPSAATKRAPAPQQAARKQPAAKQAQSAKKTAQSAKKTAPKQPAPKQPAAKQAQAAKQVAVSVAARKAAPRKSAAKSSPVRKSA